MRAPEPIAVDLPGLRLHALTWAPAAAMADAPLAVLVHGYPDAPSTWRHLGPRLAARGYRVVAPYTRGYGPTGPAPDGRYLVEDLAGDLLALHAALDGDDRAVLVGHDWGAVQVWAVTARDPGRFARHVALSIPPPAALLRPLTHAPRDLRLGLRQSRRSWYFLYNQLPFVERTLLHRMIPALWRSWSPGYDATEDLAHVRAALATRAQREAALAYYRQNLTRGFARLFGLRAGAPVLSLHGQDDGCMLAAIGERAQDLLAPGSRFAVVPGAGHWLHLERPDEIGALVDAWLDGPPSGGAATR